MKFKVVQQTDSLNHVELQGSLDCEGVQEIGGKFSNMTAVMHTDTLVDMSKVDYVSSLGLGMLVTAAKALKLTGKKIVLVNPQPKVKESILSSGLKQVLVMAADMNEAQTLLQGAKI